MSELTPREAADELAMEIEDQYDGKRKESLELFEEMTNGFNRERRLTAADRERLDANE